MFGKEGIQTNRLVATSKMSLKLSCLSACNNDIDRAEKLYNFIASDLTDLPESDPEPLTGIEQFKRGADDIFSWISSHQEDISKGLSLINGLRTRAVSGPVSEVAPIPKV